MPVLIESRVKLALATTGCIVNLSKKPALADLGNSTLDFSDNLSHGIFYTASEVRSYFASTGAPREKLNTLKIAGVVFQTSKILIVYITNPEKNKMIKTNTEGALFLKDLLRQFALTIPNAFNRVGQFYDKRPIESDSGIKYFPDPTIVKEPYALIIDKGYDGIYSYVMNNKYGRIELTKDNINTPLKDGVEVTRSKRRKKFDKESKNPYRQSMLKARTDKDAPLFKRTFIVSFTYNGMVSLDYLITHSESDWYEEAKYIFNINLPDDKILNQLYPATDTDNSYGHFIYLPVPELNELRKMHESDDNFSIVTFPDLFEPFAHAIRSNKGQGASRIRFYFFNDELIPFDNVGIYAYSGRLAGRDNLERYLISHNLNYSENEYRKLPSLFGYNKQANIFWNKVLKREISFNEIEEKLAPSPYKPKSKKSRAGQHRVQADIDAKLYEQIKRECSIKGISVSQYLKKLIKSSDAPEGNLTIADDRQIPDDNLSNSPIVISLDDIKLDNQE